MMSLRVIGLVSIVAATLATVGCVDPSLYNVPPPAPVGVRANWMS